MAVRDDFGFVEWLKDTFADESTDDLFLEDQSTLFSPLDGSNAQQMLLPDPALLIEQMLEPIAADMEIVLPQDSTDRSQDSRQTSKAGKDARPKNKNTKRYKSVAQKEAHKRYRERKRQNITAMEQEVQQKLLLLHQLENENQQLKSKMRMLETSVNCSTQIYGLMELLDNMNGMSLHSNNSSATSSSHAADGTTDFQSRPSHSASTSSTNGATTADATAAAVAACCGSDALDSSSQQQLLQALQQVKQEALPLPAEFMLIQQQQQLLPQIQQDAFANYVPQQRVVTTALQGPVSGTAEAAAAAAGNINAGQPGQLYGSGYHFWGSTSNNTLQAAAVRSAASGTAAELAAAPTVAGPSTYNGMRVSDNGAGTGGINGLWVSTAAEVLPAIASIPGSAEQPGSSGSDSLQAIFAEAQQQQLQQQQQHNGFGMFNGTAAGDAGSPSTAAAAASPDPLAGAASTLEQSMGMYKDFLQKATLLMQQQELGSPDVAAAAQARLDALTRTTISRIQPFLVAKGQGVVYDWITRNLETFQQQEAPDSLWPRVLSHMRLTQQQQQDALACYRMFGMCLSKLVDKRLALTAQYKALQQQAEQLSLHSQGQRQEAAAEQRKVKINSASMEVLQSIAKSLAAYQSLDGVFAHSVTSIFAGWQMGVAMVHSYPFLPNWHKIMQYLHQQDEQLQEQQQLQQQQLQQQQQKPATRRSGRQGRATQLGVQHAVKA